jgi:hypothetical protein
VKHGGILLRITGDYVTRLQQIGSPEWAKGLAKKETNQWQDKENE